MITTKQKPKTKAAAPGLSAYYVPTTQTLIRKAKVKVMASNEQEAADMARALVKSLTPSTVMTALATQSSSVVEYGRPWKREVIPANTAPKMEVILPGRRAQ